MKIYLGTDHAGYELKEKIKGYLIELSYEFEDMGAFSMQESDDYNEFILAVAKKVAQNPTEDRGIIFGGSGQGEAIQANRIKSVRATVFYGGDLSVIRLSREHNNANILSLGARFVPEEQAKEAIKLWLKEPFTDTGRHKRRNDKIDSVM